MITQIKYFFLTKLNNLHKTCVQRKQKRQYNNFKRKSVSTINNVTTQEVVSKKEEIRLFAIMRNESLRLSHFIEHYKIQGLDRFFLIDNNSTDDSIELALSHLNIHVFKTTDSYINHWYWMEHLLEKYGKGHWCVVVDIDELLCFPHVEELSLRRVCQFLDDSGSTAMRALLLDMYSDKSVQTTAYVAGQNPLDSIPYYDTAHYEVTFPYFDRKRWKIFSSTHFTGGMRERVFGKTQHITSLNKFPLFKNTTGVYLGQGMHAINGAKVSDIQGVLFHTKFLNDSIQEAEEESVRGQHFDGASAYKGFKQQFDQKPDLCLATSESVRYQDSAQLVKLGLMKTTPQFEEFVKAQIKKDSINVL